MPKKKSKGKKPGRYSPAFDSAKKKAIVSAYKKGGTLEELAAKHSCSTSKVRKILLVAKVDMRPRGPKEGSKMPKRSKPKAKKVVKPKAKKVVKPKAKKVVKPKAKKAVTKKVLKKAAATPKKSGLTDAQRAAKNARDRARRAAKKTGLNATLAAVANPAAK